MAGERVLVVEDNDKNMKLFRDVLQASGYSTFEATTGEQAVELALVHEPALVLMDVQLPGIDGVEALEQLRQDERTSSIPALALTAQAMSGDRDRFLDAGFDGYLSKPVDVAELLQAVREHCSRGVPRRLASRPGCASRTRLVLAADADRRRIERELHDGAQQDLVGLAVKLQQARGLVDSDPAAAGVLVDEMRGDVQESLDRLRSLAQRIHPPQLEAGGLPAALRSAAASARSSSPYRRRGERRLPPGGVRDGLPLHRRRVRAPRHRDDGGDRHPRKERNGGVRDRRRGRRRRPGRRAARRDPRSGGGPGRPADDHGSVGRRHADRRLAPDPRRR